MGKFYKLFNYSLVVGEPPPKKGLKSINRALQYSLLFLYLLIIVHSPFLSVVNSYFRYNDYCVLFIVVTTAISYIFGSPRHLSNFVPIKLRNIGEINNTYEEDDH